MAADALTGYRRADGRVGIRNHVVALPVDDLSNAAVEGIAALVPGVIALPHAYGRLQFGEDLELTFRTYEHGSVTEANALGSIKNPALSWSVAPQGIEAYATFMKSIGLITKGLKSWKQLVYPNLYNVNGS